MTLRARLVLALVGLAAAGLLVAGLVTWSLLESSLTDRLDDQLVASVPMARAAVAEQAGLPGRGPGGGPGDPMRRPPLGLVGLHAEVRAPDGTVLATSDAALGGDTSTVPDLPDDLPSPTAADPTLTSVDSADGTPYRVLLQQLPSGDVLVVAAPLAQVEDTLSRLVTIEAIVAAVVLAALAALAWLAVRAGLRPLDRMETTASAIAAGDLTRRVPDVDPRTEVGRLGRTFNTMVDRIEASFAARDASEARLRRFLSDASHELRTPLTSIRGYAELFRRGAAQRPEDLASSMRRIEEEATRMGVLVDDLLLLARLDQGRPLEAAPVALDLLAADAARDASVVAPDHRVTTDLAPVTVAGDDARLRQVVGNLLTNAVTHTPPGTHVDVRVATEDDVAVVEVVDDGPGIADDDAATVFDRFTRVDDGRTREKGGTGLGLAIVAAICEAHGGRVMLRTAAGDGCTFRVELPLADPAAPSM